MKQPNGCSTPALKSNAAKQWIKEELAQKKENGVIEMSFQQEKLIKVWLSF